MRPIFLLSAVLVALAATTPPASAAPAVAAVDAKEEIAQLIRDLGDVRWEVREAATQRLRQIGPPAVPALKEAAQAEDPEIKVRTRQILDDMLPATPEKLAAHRNLVQEAFNKADYAVAGRLSREIILSEKASQTDWLWLGHCCQLAGAWGEAVEAYRKVVSLMDEDLQAGFLKDDAANQPAPPLGPMGRVRGNVVEIGPVRPAGPVPLSDRDRANRIEQRSTLMHWIARIQRAELKAPAAAAKTVKEALDYLDSSKTEDAQYIWQTLARELPPLMHEAGDLPGAIQAWQQAIDLQKHHSKMMDFRDSPLVDVERIYADLLALPKDADRPEAPWILPVKEGAETRLDLDDPGTQERAYQRGTYEYYAFAPPPGEEFGAMEFACDIEQINLRCGGQFSCMVIGGDPPGRPQELGSIDWTNKQAGREVLRKSFPVPPGAGLVHVRIGRPRDFIVHSVLAKAALRPATKDAPPIAADAWMQLEAYPEKGRIAWGGMNLANDTARSGVRPGRDTLRFSAPGRAESIEVPFEVKPGRRYGLFFNLDSPFRWRQLDLELAAGGANTPCLSIQRLGGGGYLAVWSGADNKILSATSKDLVRWSRPAPLPFNSVFDNIAPGTYGDADGSVWLAFFSNRLNLQTSSSAGYTLWITNTRDGNTWAVPRRIEVQTIEGWPLNPPAMLAAPDGSRWIFCRNRAASADSLDRITRLERMELPAVNGNQLNMWNPQIFHDGKRFHLACDNFGDGIYHMTSTSGMNWTEPHLLVAKIEGAETGRPQLIRAGERWLLLYAGGGTWCLETVDLGGNPFPAGQGMKVSSGLVPLAGVKPLLADGKVFFIAGENTAWLLEADLKELTRLINVPK